MRENGLFNKLCTCDLGSIWFWIGLIAFFIAGFIANRGMRYEKHATYAILSALAAIIVLPLLTGIQVPLFVGLVVAGLGFAIGRYFDAEKVPFKKGGNHDLRWL